MFSTGSTRGRLNGAGTPFNWAAAIGYGREPYASIVAGKGALTAGPQGVQIGIFGWVDPVTGQVTNTQVAGALLGFVIPVLNWYNWQRVMPSKNALGRVLIIRAGVECVIANQGDFTTTFLLGAQAGQQVYVDPATGFPYGGNPGGLVPTPWTVMESGCTCNAKLRISSFVKPTS